MSLIAVAALVGGLDRASLLNEASADCERALQHNDVPALERILASDWMIIDADGRPLSREQFLAALRSGALSHSEMRSSDTQVRIFGDAAIYVARVEGRGTYGGKPFKFSERSTDVWTWTDGRWICVLTQLTTIAQPRK